LLFCVRKKVRKVLKKLLREIDRLEQSKTKKVEQIKMLQDEVNKIDEELKPYYTLKKQYDKLESTANQLFENN
jgi:cell division protein FtsB